MKPWQIFGVGLTGLALWLLLPALLPYLLVTAAAVLLAAIAAGFFFIPDKDLWTVWTRSYSAERGDEGTVQLHVAHEPIAIRVQVARLWLLYLPTVAAVGYLLLAAARDLWPLVPFQFDLVPWVAPMRFGVAAVWYLLSTWLSERWLLRRADATQIQGPSARSDRASFYFTVGPDYFGGAGVPLFLHRREPMLRSIVMYRRSNPSHNRLVVGFMFHRFEVAGRGVPDLDAARATAGSRLAENPAKS